MKCLRALLLIGSLLFAQDELILTDGRIITGELDKGSISESSTSIRFKPREWQKFAFYNVDQINFIRSWNGRLLFPKGVMVNTTSGIYHLPNVRHLPSEDFRQFYPEERAAISAGNKACTACFDPHPSISDYTTEQQLVKAVIMQIQNSNEIMYEHPQLTNLQQLMEKVLCNWPEDLKGYNYRIQIIRDDEPNAHAVAGGNLYFTTGLIDMAETEDELEGIIAHEIAHVERRHTLREFKDYQRKKAALATLTTVLAIAAVANNSDNLAALTTITAAIGTFAIEFSRIGYSRDLEQEADMFAQTYLSLNQESTGPLLTVLDKLATHTMTRNGFIEGANAFSSHPNIIARINQIEKGQFFQYETPLVMKLYPLPGKKTEFEIQPEFIEMKINRAYKTVSSDIAGQDEILLLGTIINHHPELSFRINSISLNFLGSLGQTTLGGIEEVTVPWDGETEFVGKIHSPEDLSVKVADSVFNKHILPFGVDVSAIVLQPGKNEKQVIGYQNIQCTMTVN